eukprot:GILK01007839.1.p1 GENE.GILK01007839.1~~GILK01007839.1.p1  ORF type:complete len:261 (-),score=56.85 GILK01007839.1:232-1014(-)
MSLGWLTESALVLKKGKEIEVDNASLVDLKALIFRGEEEKKRKHPGGSRREKKKQKKTERKNKGVESRHLKDLAEEASQTHDHLASLTAKAEIYEKLSKGEVNDRGESFLVDFERKGAPISNTSVSISSLSSSQTAAEDTGAISLGRRMEAERRAWEQQAMQEVAQGFANEEVRKPRPAVLQVYDKVLSREEKEHLVGVVEETYAGREKVLDVKQKRKQLLEARMNKIKAKDKTEPADTEGMLPEERPTVSFSFTMGSKK